jgi:phenylalanyl-tRNA synthetase alpha chain
MLYKLAAKCRGEHIKRDEKEFTHGASDIGEAANENGKYGKKDDGFTPAKLFSIDRVFRNETMDATHLAEFHQVEGVVADRGLTLADLIGELSSFTIPVSVPLSLLMNITFATRVHAGLLQQNGD